MVNLLLLWVYLYLFWELNLIKELGFDTNLRKFKKNDIKSNQILNLDIDGTIYQTPQFLISDSTNEEVDNNSIKKGLVFTRNIMMNKFFIPNNLTFPRSRVILENYFI